MIGFFDSGLGGLTILHAFMDVRPGSYVYLGDNQRAPYGSRSAQEVERFTIEGVQWLIDRGCKLIVLACNTASANALRNIQMKWLPVHAPDVRVLGILVPTVEAITGVDWQADMTRDHDLSVIVFATPSTVLSGAYEREILKRVPNAQVISEACSELVSLIEQRASMSDIRVVVHRHVMSACQRMGRKPDVVLLGCTHYALIEDVFRERFDPSTNIFSQPNVVAASLSEYLKRHPEFPSSSSSIQFFTTGNPEDVSRASQVFFPERLVYQRAVLLEMH